MSCKNMSCVIVIMNEKGICTLKNEKGSLCLGSLVHWTDN